MCQAAWLSTVAFGNLVVIIVAESSLFANRVRNAAMYASNSTHLQPVLLVKEHFLCYYMYTYVLVRAKRWMFGSPVSC